ncbi:mannitol dehydrogenase family protein [Marinomonas ostreistagni]|uniref:mannitol dehydrogenase family protein n=1 Tax=Marinomonas ostreistagni TaxID=359209 RepID=UPI0019514C79|nr:mannitol dehydrogenase family protein [Marinomonas ostreistagni]MBM6550687.1 mannitol dehydrogenase family protein [Marinomonas ostreistagni]
MNITYEHSQIAPGQHQAGIVHIGLGAFHRAHQAVYIEKTLAAKGGDWALVSANIRSNVSLVEQLNDANNRFHVVEYASSEQATVREICAMKEALFAGDEAGRQALIERLVDTHTKIVTMTVTEKGYFLSPASGELQLDHADLQHDLTHPNSPKTVIGLLAESLRQRRNADMPPFTVLCCDNMPHNGQRVKNAVVSFAKALDTSLAEWILQHVAFPSSMVDRIVPAMTEADFLAVNRDTGIDSPTVVKCEQFSQWVIEDDFPQGRPQWQDFGVQMVADVSAYEMMKLRMLNGSHSLLAYLGPIAGYETVAQALTDADIEQFLRNYMMQEVAPTLTSFEHDELSAYCEALIQRFKNDSLHHKLLQIAMDGSQKLPQRWLQSWLELTQASRTSAAIELGIAGWMRYVINCQATQSDLNDPLQAALYEAISGLNDKTQKVQALLAFGDVFPVQMSTDQALVERLTCQVARLSEQPLAETLHSLFSPAV